MTGYTEPGIHNYRELAAKWGGLFMRWIIKRSVTAKENIDT